MASELEQVKEKLNQLKKILERREIEMQSIQHIGKALSSELRIEQLLQLIMDEVTRLMNAERSTFYIVDEERGELWSKVAQKAILIHNNSKSVTINKPKAKTVVCKKSDKLVVTTTSKKTVGISKCQ